MTWVKERGMVRLDKKYLRTDFKGVSTDDIVYSILSSGGQPKYGTTSSLESCFHTFLVKSTLFLIY